jgi:hypothetical protein
MRIRTDGEYNWRTSLYDRTADSFDVDTKRDGIDAVCEFSIQMLRNLERAAEHDDMTEDLAELLSTHRVETGVTID